MKNPIWTTLIQCSACQHAIAPLAEKCPSCGAPNTWRHPLVERFWAERDGIKVARPFTFTSDKHSIQGQTAAEPVVPIWLIVVGATCSGAAFGLLWAGVFAVAGAMANATSNKRKTFAADLQAGTWSSNDDDFWRPVKGMLGL